MAPTRTLSLVRPNCDNCYLLFIVHCISYEANHRKRFQVCNCGLNSRRINIVHLTGQQQDHWNLQTLKIMMTAMYFIWAWQTSGLTCKSCKISSHDSIYILKHKNWWYSRYELYDAVGLDPQKIKKCNMLRVYYFCFVPYIHVVDCDNVSNDTRRVVSLRTSKVTAIQWANKKVSFYIRMAQTGHKIGVVLIRYKMVNIARLSTQHKWLHLVTVPWMRQTSNFIGV